MGRTNENNNQRNGQKRQVGGGTESSEAACSPWHLTHQS
jgi:hypothetical protein